MNKRLREGVLVNVVNVKDPAREPRLYVIISLSQDTIYATLNYEDSFLIELDKNSCIFEIVEQLTTDQLLTHCNGWVQMLGKREAHWEQLNA